MHAGTDAGGFVEHGRVADEVTALGRADRRRGEAMFAASHSARDWLGLPSYDIGAPADLVVYADDPARRPRRAAASGASSGPAPLVRADGRLV